MADTIAPDDNATPTVVNREWTEASTSTLRYEQLLVERDGEQVTIPITNIDHPEHPEYWDADRVYVFDGRLVAESHRADGSVWTVHESGRTSSGDITLAGEIDDHPTDVEVADVVLWQREANDDAE